MSAVEAGARTGTTDRAAHVILASASLARRRLLDSAGVTFTCEAPAIDEAAVKNALQLEGARSEQAAETLAELKAQRISQRHAGALVIGADQLLDCEGMWFDKPHDKAQAAAQLRALSGQTHRLISAAVVVRDGQRLWHHVATARLGIRPLDDAFIAAYLERAGDQVLTSVGAYQLEGLGVQLFSVVEGDYFTILGLPLLPLLDFLRQHGALPA